MAEVSRLRPRWWTAALETALQQHLSQGGGMGRRSLQRALDLNQLQGRVLASLLARPSWITDERLAVARALRAQGQARVPLARALGVPQIQAQVLLEYIQAAEAPAQPAGAPPQSEEQQATLYLKEGQKMPSPQAILEELGLDPSLWEIVGTKVERGSWDMGRKAERVQLRYEGREMYGERHDSGVLHVQHLYRWRVTVTLKPRRPLIEFKDALAAMVAEARVHAPYYPPLERPPAPPAGRHLFVVGLHDLHLGKLAWGPETGQSYDRKIAARLALEAVEGLIARVQPYGHIEQVILPVGSDLLHTDNANGTTTRGTPQDVDSRWQLAFSSARRLIMEIVDRLRTLAPVRLVVIPGNHDGTLSYYLGEALAGWYHRCEDVAVDNDPGVRKFFRWRSVLLWFYHGHQGKPADWFADMANHAGPAWYECPIREGILGHIHHERTLEYKGVLFRHLRSLSATDAWHASNFYGGNLRGLQGLLYHERIGPYVPIPYYLLEEADVRD